MCAVFKIGFLFICLLSSGVEEPKLSDRDDVSPWDWKPSWRDNTDCGPNALYVLLNLEGHSVKLDQVKALVPLDPVKGCSLEALRQASEKLGFPVEARFVKSNDLAKLPPPFIFHGAISSEKNLGHFVVAVGFDKKKRNFALIDPVRETFGWNPEASVLMDYSGYVLMPKYPLARKWNRIAGLSMILCGVGIFVLVYYQKINNGTKHRRDVCKR